MLQSLVPTWQHTNFVLCCLGPCTPSPISPCLCWQQTTSMSFCLSQVCVSFPSQTLRVAFLNLQPVPGHKSSRSVITTPSTLLGSQICKGHYPTQCSSTVLTLGPFNTVLHVVVTLPTTTKLFLLLLHSCNFATVMNCNMTICAFC